MTTRLIRINCNGKIHDDDSGIFGSEDEEDDFSWSRNMTLQSGGFSNEWQEAHTVDGEVQLRAKLRLEVDASDRLSLSGDLELWEGPNWTLENSHAIDTMIIDPGGKATVYEGTLADDQGDWARIKLEVKNDSETTSTTSQPLTQEPTTTPKRPIGPRPRILPRGKGDDNVP